MKRLVLALALGFALIPLGPAQAGTSVVTDSLCNFDRHINYWPRLVPERPCAGEPVSLVIQSCGECDNIVSGWSNWAGTVHLRFDSRLYCPRIPCQPDSLVVPLGSFAAGPQSLTLSVTSVVGAGEFPDSSGCIIHQLDSLSFYVNECPPPPPPPSGLPFVTRVQIGPPPAMCPECPSVICQGDSIPVFVSGVFPNDCYELLRIEVLPRLFRGILPLPPVVRLVVGVNTFSSHCQIPSEKPFHGQAVLPGLPAGGYDLEMEEQWVPLTVGTVVDTIFHARYPFTVQPCATGSLPFVTRFEIGEPPCIGCPPRICPGDSILVTVEGIIPDQCWEFRGIELLPSPIASPFPAPPVVRLVMAPRCEPCLILPTPFRGSVKLPPLPIGHYNLLAEEAALRCDGGLDTLWHASFPFSVVDACSTGGPGPLVPLVHTIQVGRPPCPSCPPEVCPGDSVRVLIAGAFPDNCWEFKGVEVLPSDATGIIPEPPRLRVNLFRNECLDRACALVIVPFAARVMLPPLLPGIYQLEVEEHQTVLCHDPPEASFRYAAGFQVVERCSTVTPPGCFLADWLHGSERCDAFVDREHPGQATMTFLTNTVPVAGLQGTLNLYPAGLRIAGLTPVGAAATWNLAWQPTADGARYVMFSTDGSVIPDTDPVYPPGPVLRVTVAVAGNVPPAPLTHLTTGEMIASDPQGREVPPCPILTLVQPAARICFGDLRCDFNHDGVADIRDLVLMVHCVFGYGFCPDTTTSALDCNHDGQKSLDDLLCCARVILHNGMPDSVPGRPEPAVQVSFGAPIAKAGGLDVPLRIEGVDRLGAVRLALRFPSDRFDVVGVELPSGVSEWLGLHEVDGSDLLVGLICVGAQEVARGSLDLTLHLSLKPGQQAGGEIRLASGDFSGPDGAALTVGFTPATLPVGASGRLALSAAQPNPFARETQFSVTLPRASDVELAVHDLAGRRIATIFRGRLEAGTRGFRWAGVGEDGARARDGIYFVNLRGAGDDVTRKVILLRGN